VKWSSDRIAGFPDAEELVLGALPFACARTCGTKSNAAAATSKEPHNLVALFSDSTRLSIGLSITDWLAFVHSIVDMTFIEQERRQAPWTQHNPVRWAQTGCQATSMLSPGSKCLVRRTLEGKRHILPM